MQTPLRLLALLTLLASPAAAQFESARQLIPDDSSSQIPGVPRDGLWTRQFYIGIGGGFFGDDEDGWLDTVTHDRITWIEDQRVYRGMLRGRAMALGSDRYLIERDLDAKNTTWITLVEWSGPELHLYKFDTDAGSAFERHLRASGASITDEVVGGDRETVLDALRSMPLEGELNERYRRPSHAEMGLIWNHFELQLWYERHNRDLREVDASLDQLHGLGNLHLAHEFASNAIYGDCANLDALAFSPYDYSALSEQRVQSLYDRAKQLVERIEKRIEERFQWLAGEVEVLEHQQKQTDPNDPFDRVVRPRPGQVLQFHIQVVAQDGTVIEDTHVSEEPWTVALMGELPEGIQYGLRLLGFEERITVRIPAALAFGAEYGDVDVTLEILDSIRNRQHRPPIDGILRAEIANVDAEETASGLRSRELAPGEGATPTRGQKVELGMMSWNAFGEPLAEPGTLVAELGSDALLTGVNEALASMQVGAERVLFLPRHLADQDPSRAGMAQCVVVKLISIVE